MTVDGLPVPQGFTLTTLACRQYLVDGWTDAHEAAVADGVSALEAASGKRFGDPANPLLVSVRSGAQISMPGMMDTVLNVGMNGQVEAALARLTVNPTFAADTHKRALLSFAQIVLGADGELLRSIVAGAATPAEMRAALVAEGLVVPEDAAGQVVAAVKAVFASWQSERARHYRAIESIDESIGTAATVQAMVFGNLGDASGTGVAFTRDPSTGENVLMGDFLQRAQGEDVVAGDHATRPLREMADLWPDAWAELQRIADLLERDYADLVDIEFTVEQGKLWMLQARRGKRSPQAAFAIAVDMAEDAEFPLTRAEAVERCSRYLEDPPVVTTSATSDTDDEHVIATGLAASPGRAVGVLCVDVDDACSLGEAGVDVVLVRRETSPSDVHGMAAAVGLVTTLGGLVSHAAVVARDWGKPAVVGASGIELAASGIVAHGASIPTGTVITVDGNAGRVLMGAHVGEGQVLKQVNTIRTWQSEAAIGGVADTDVGANPTAARDIDFSTMHALRIKGMAASETLAAMTGTSEAEVTAALQAMEAGGLAKFFEARDMWMMQPAGREEHADRLPAQVEALDLDALPYDNFLGLNDRLKQVCTDWQVRDGEPNDHSDGDYDANVIDQLVALNADAQPTVALCGAVIPWAGTYGPRLGAACDRVVAGDPKALTGVMCDSYHDVWMELHEDLILIQGIDRAAEGST